MKNLSLKLAGLLLATTSTIASKIDWLTSRSERSMKIEVSKAAASCTPSGSMARMEGRVAVEEFFRHFGPGELRLAPGYEYHLMPHFLEYGPERLDVIVPAGAK